MDRKILAVSIMTILVLLGVFWVFAASISSDYQLTNLTTNGTSINWTQSGETDNLTFSLKLNHATATNIDPNNITNITIKLNSNSSDVGSIEFTGAVNATFTVNGAVFDKGLECRELDDGSTIECLNTSNVAAGVESNISGNGTVVIWTDLTATSTARETVYNWLATATDNDSTSSTHTFSNWGVDGLAPRLVQFNISDATNEWTSTKGELNGSSSYTISNNSDVIVKFILTEHNRESGTVTLFWNDTTHGNLDLNGSMAVVARENITNGINGTQDLTGNSTCSPSNTGTSICTYDWLLPKGNFSKAVDGRMISFALFTNDSFNHTSIFYKFNVTIDAENPTATASVSKDQTMYTQREVTVSCAGSDKNSTSDVVVNKITLLKPNGETVSVSDTSSHTFRNQDTGTAGEYKAYCKVKDVAGHTAESSRVSFDVYYKTGHVSTTSSGSSSSIADVDVSEESGEASGKEGESQTFTTDGTTTHRLTFLSVGTDTATIRIESEPIDITLSIGESKEVDLDADGVNDLKVTLNAITNGKADVTVVSLVKETEAETTSSEPTTTGEEKTEGLTTSNINTWLIVLIILVIIAVVYFVLKGRKSKKGEMKFSKRDFI